MKKILVIALAVVMLVSVFALTACNKQVLTGECHYVSYGTDYGCKVDVTLKGDVIANVKLYTDEETGWHRTSANNPDYGWTSFETTEAAYEGFLAKFIGKTVAEVVAIDAYATAQGQGVVTEGWSITGATQSAARVIVAVQDALAKIGKSAYGLVHKSYAGKATVYVVDGKVVAADLDEACLPTQVAASADLGEYVVEVAGKGGKTTYYYKTVNVDDLTFVYDTEKGDYIVNGTPAKTWLATAANSQKYFEAAAANKVVAVKSATETVVLKATQLIKSQNGYWDAPAETALGWDANVAATCNYVVENGFDAITAKDAFTANAGEGKLDNEWKDANGVLTGATWTDMWDYLVILKAAYEA